ELANIRGEILILLADSPAWATRLRYPQNRLLWRLHSELGVESRKLRIKAKPRQQTRPRTEPARRPQGAPRRHLLQAASEMDDPDLAAALRRLAGQEPAP